MAISIFVFALRFYTYGSIPVENHLKIINDEALSKFEAIETNTEVPSQTRWSTPVSILLSHYTIVMLLLQLLNFAGIFTFIFGFIAIRKG